MEEEIKCSHILCLSQGWLARKWRHTCYRRVINDLKLSLNKLRWGGEWAVKQFKRPSQEVSVIDVWKANRKSLKETRLQSSGYRGTFLGLLPIKA